MRFGKNPKEGHDCPARRPQQEVGTPPLAGRAPGAGGIRCRPYFRSGNVARLPKSVNKLAAYYTENLSPTFLEPSAPVRVPYMWGTVAEVVRASRWLARLAEGWPSGLRRRS